jgi:acetoin utilization protein AcuB
LEETADILLKHRISGVPVMDHNEKLVGVITQSDLFRVLITLSGFGKKGIQFGLQVEDRPGSIKEVADIIRTYGGRLASILTSYSHAPEGRRNVYIRTFGIDRNTLGDLKGMLSQKAALLYIVDHRENTREIFDPTR